MRRIISRAKQLPWERGTAVPVESTALGSCEDEADSHNGLDLAS